MHPTRRLIPFLVIFVALGSLGQFCSDPYFIPKESSPMIVNPAHSGPVVLFDKTAANRFHVTGFEPFELLLRQDGYRVRDFDVAFDAEDCADHDCPYWNALVEEDDRILFILSTLPAPNPHIDADQAALIKDWVELGGSVMIVADHAPYGDGAEALMAAFGIQNSGEFSAEVTLSRVASDIQAHPISDGRLGLVPDESIQTLRVNGGRLVETTPPTGYTSATVVTKLAGNPALPKALVTTVEYANSNPAIRDGRVYFAGDVYWHSQRIWRDMWSGEDISVTILDCYNAGQWSASACARKTLERKCDEQSGIGEELCGIIGATGSFLGRKGFVDQDNQQFTLNVIHWLDHQL